MKNKPDQEREDEKMIQLLYELEIERMRVVEYERNTPSAAHKLHLANTYLEQAIDALHK